MKNFLAIIIVLTFLGNFPSSRGQMEGLRNFVLLAVQDFNAWTVSNGLDPTPKIPDEMDLQHRKGFVKINRGKIRNQVVSGYSTGFDNITVEKAQFLPGKLKVILSPSSFNISGDYEMRGTLFSSIPIHGSGKFHAKTETTVQNIIELDIYGFSISYDGYIDLSAGEIRAESYFQVGSISFQGLSAKGYKKEVEKVLREAYQQQINQNYEMFPMAQYLFTYLNELFAKTQIVDIIETPLPTPSPCQSFYSEQEGTVVLSEIILDKNVTLKENGKKVEIVKKFMVFEKEL